MTITNNIELFINKNTDITHRRSFHENDKAQQIISQSDNEKSSLINQIITRNSQEVEKYNNLALPKTNNLHTEILKKIEKINVTANPFSGKTSSDFGVHIFEEFTESREWIDFVRNQRANQRPNSIHEFAVLFCYYGHVKAGKWSMDHAQEQLKQNRKITKEEVQKASIADINRLTPLQKLAVSDQLSEGQIREFFLSGSEPGWQHHLLKQSAGINVQKEMFRAEFSMDISQELTEKANAIQKLLKEKYPLPQLNESWSRSVREQADLSSTCKSDPDKTYEWINTNNHVKELPLADKVVKDEFTKFLSSINEMLRPSEFDSRFAPPGVGNNYELRDGLQWVTIKKDTGQAFPAAPSTVAELVEETRKWLESSIQLVEEGKANPILVASETYFRFVSIHPMEDGNGRTARVLMNKILYDAGIVAPVLKNSDAACVTARIGKSQKEYPGETKETVLQKVLAAYKEQLAV